MSTSDEHGFSSNGRDPDAWSRAWAHLRIDRRSPGYCRVTFDHPPINAITSTTVAELAELVGLIEQDADLNVVVFESAHPEFYLSHEDMPDGTRRTWVDALVRLVRAPVVSVAAIRGGARGVGSEFVLACDLRFASRENTLIGRLWPGVGVPPRGGPTAGLPRLVGRGRALEILLVADDCDGPRAEQYGYVNRLIADDRLDSEVEAIAWRLSHFDHDAVTRTKVYVESAAGG